MKTQRHKKGFITTAAALVAAASLIGCTISQEEAERMTHYQAHFDIVLTPSIFICLEDRLIGFYKDGPLRFERLPWRIPTGTYNAYMRETHLVFIRPGEQYEIPVFGDLPIWWNAEFWDGCPALVYESED